MGPAYDPSSKFYGCVQHIGSVHKDVYIRSLPQDLHNTGAITDDNVCMRLGYNTPPSSVCAPDNVLVHIRPKDGYTHFHGSFWSTHENYVVAKAGNKQEDATWAAYIYDISGLNGDTYVKVLSKDLDKDHDYMQLWVDWPGSIGVEPVARSRAGAAARLVPAPGRGLWVYPGNRGSHRVSIMDSRGRVLLERMVVGQGRSMVPMDRLPAGRYIAELTHDNTSIVRQPVTWMGPRTVSGAASR
jgi:hypothetical protein